MGRWYSGVVLFTNAAPQRLINLDTILRTISLYFLTWKLTFC